MEQIIVLKRYLYPSREKVSSMLSQFIEENELDGMWIKDEEGYVSLSIGCFENVGEDEEDGTPWKK